MKTIQVAAHSTELISLLDQARGEDIIVRTSDGSEFMLSAVDDFEYEVTRTRQNEKLMSLLEERSKSPTVASLDEVKRRLGLD